MSLVDDGLPERLNIATERAGDVVHIVMVQVQEAEDCGAGGHVLVVAGENKNVNGKYKCFVISKFFSDI